MFLISLLNYLFILLTKNFNIILLYKIYYYYYYIKFIIICKFYFIK